MERAWSNLQFHGVPERENRVNFVIIFVVVRYFINCFLIRFTYSLSNKKEVLSFQKPGPLWFVLFVRCSVIREWSVLKPGKMSAFVIVVLRLELVKKKSRRQCISGFLLLQVNLLASGFRICQISTRSNKLTVYKTSLSEFLWVVGFPPILSFWTSRIKL